MSVRKSPVRPASRPAPRALESDAPAPGGDAVVRAHARTAIDLGIAGQEAAKATLATALLSGHIPHAWIFHGPSGVGKCTTALAFAGVVVDPEATDAGRAQVAPSRESRSSSLLRAGTHPDVRIIRADLASTSADRDIRERKQINIPIGLLREHLIGGSDRGGAAIDAPVARSSVLGAGKAFIIDEAERLEPDAQNALLKTLEEPPRDTVIVLVTTSVDRLIPTVRSRCQRVAFQPLSRDAMSGWLDANLGEVTGSARAFVEFFADGSPGAAVKAVELGMESWYAELSPMIERVVKGECPIEMSERMHDIASAVAEAAVKRDPDASKEVANRRAVNLLFALLGAEVRRRMGASGTPTKALDYWASVPPIMATTESHIRANVNLKLALADFVAQWALLRSRIT